MEPHFIFLLGTVFALTALAAAIEGARFTIMKRWPFGAVGMFIMAAASAIAALITWSLL